MTHRLYAAIMAGSLALLLPTAGFSDVDFTQTNILSDLPGVANSQDLTGNLTNPWGIAFSGTSPIWVADNGTGLATIYNAAGTSLIPPVTIPPPGGQTFTAAPDGIIFNGNSSAFGGSHFIFSAEDGTISAWTSGTNATLEVDNYDNGTGAVYKGLASGVDGTRTLLYASNFRNGTIDVFDSNFKPTTVGGSFSDPTIPAGYAPFNVENINGLLYVTYALQNAAKHDDVAGLGNGFVRVYNTDGVLQSGFNISNGLLDSPWGLALAPAGWGSFGGDLLVGNFGNGQINVYNPTNGAFIGTVDGTGGTPLINEGLWGLAFANGAFGTSTNELLFTAGIPLTPGGALENHGLFGSIQPVPEPGYFGVLGLGAGALLWRRRFSKP